VRGVVKVREVMKKDVIKISPDATVADAAKIMTNNRVGSLVVVGNGDEPKDLVTESDVTTVVARGLDPKDVKISDFKKNNIKKMKRLVFVKPDDNILQVAKIMVKNGIKRVPVVDKGKLKGIIADKEILLISPELIEIMSEKMKERIAMVPTSDQIISGLCEDCGGYSDDLQQFGNRWICSECRSEE
jgi:CBS domain-containing protein